MKRFTFLLVMAFLLSFPLAAQTVIIPFGSNWKYLDNGSNQGLSWRPITYNDAGWKTGKGMFGYGNGEEATLISYGSNAKKKYVTTYFRKAIDLPNPGAFKSYKARIKRDDGVIVFVNGIEVYRDNLPHGSVYHTTLANSADDDDNKAQSFTLTTANFVRGTNLIAVEVHQTTQKSDDMAFDLELTGLSPVDQLAPTVVSINRQSPEVETTSANSVIFRLTFSEPVVGVDAADFGLVFTESARGELAAIAPSGTDGNVYDITVHAITGHGTLGLNLNPSGTGIADAAGNALAGGITGQTFIIEQVPAREGFVNITPLNPLPAIYDATKGKHQSKVFTHAGHHWSIFANTTGTHLWRLDGTQWTYISTLTRVDARADCIVDGDVTHIFLFYGIHSQLVSLEYVAASNTYQPWSGRNTKVDVTLDQGVETASIARDGTGRLWLVTDAVTDINVRWSDAPYSTWSSPITVASGIATDDVGAIINMPAAGRIGLLWGNQETERFGFRTHADGTDPAAWTPDEVPASQSALQKGKGMADDHLNMKVASDGTLYCAVKTGYDEIGYPKIALLVRRPAGTWDNCYEVSQKGTAPIVLLNEAIGKIRVIYSSQTYGGDILYKESSTANISFGTEFTLIREVNNYATSSHENFTSDVVILASNSKYAVGVIATDNPSAAPAPDSMAVAAGNAAVPAGSALLAYPNPFTSRATISFTLPADGDYTLALYDGNQGQVVYSVQGQARAGERNAVEIEGSQLPGGLYFARLQSGSTTQDLRLVLER